MPARHRFKLDRLREAGFQVECHSHAAAILAGDFPDVAAQLAAILLRSTIPIEEIVGSGGGETKGTQRLRRSLHEHGWRKHRFDVAKTIDGVQRETISHEVDHIARFPTGVIALEIEWNNKDPFFDRDLENYKRLHADGAISIGILVTRGTSLQDDMRSMVRRFAVEKKVNSPEDLARIGLSPTRRQLTAYAQRVRSGSTFAEGLGRKLRRQQVWGGNNPLAQAGRSGPPGCRQSLSIAADWPAGQSRHV